MQQSSNRRSHRQYTQKERVCLVKTAVSHESPPRCEAGGPAWAAAIPSGCVAAGSETERGEENIAVVTHRAGLRASTS